MNPTVPALQVDGFVVNKDAILVKTFEYFLTSDYSQSTTFRGGVASLKYLIANYEDTYSLKNDIISSLTRMYGAYFKTPLINVDIVETDDTAVIKYIIDVKCWDDDGVMHSLSKEITEYAKQILNYDTLIDDLNNYK